MSSHDLLSVLFLFTTVVISCVTFAYIALRSRLQTNEGKIIGLFTAFYSLAFLQRIIEILSLDDGQGVMVAFWYAFGPLIYGYVYFITVPTGRLRKCIWVLFFASLLTELCCVLVIDLQILGLFRLSDDVINLVDWFYRHIASLSFIHFSVFVAATIYLIFKFHFVRQVKILRSVEAGWINGMLLFLLLVMINNIVFIDQVAVLYGSTMGFSIYFLLMFVFNPSLLSSVENRKNLRLKEVIFDESQPIILLESDLKITYVNSQLIALLTWKGGQLVGRPFETISPSFTLEKWDDEKEPGQLALVNKNGVSFRCEVSIEKLAITRVYQQPQVYFIIRVGAVLEEKIHYSKEEKSMQDHLHDLLESQKIYLNPMLQQKEVAEQLGISPRKLGEFISRYYEKKFPALINEYRVNHAKVLLLDSEYAEASVEQIGKESGFNHKSSFFSTFKQHVGRSPSEYRNGEGQ